MILCAWVTNWESQEYLQKTVEFYKEKPSGLSMKIFTHIWSISIPKGLLGLLEVAFAELQRAEETHWSPLYLLGSLGISWASGTEPPVEIPVEIPVETPVEAYKMGTWTAAAIHRETWPAMTSGQSISTKCRL